jgi:hypothetical protein
MVKLRLGFVSLLALSVLAGCGSGSGHPGKLDGAAGAGGSAVDTAVGSDTRDARDLQAQDASMGGAGGSRRLDAPIPFDVGAGAGGAGVGGQSGSGGLGSGGSTSSGDLDGGKGIGSGGRGIDSAAGFGGGFGSGGLDGGRLDRASESGGGLDGGGFDGSLDGDGGANCVVMQVAASRVPADVLLLLDRSASMNYSIAQDCNCTSTAGSPVCADLSSCTARWPALTAAVDTTLTASTAIHWGLKLFASPTGDSCFVNAGVEVPISAASVPIIQSQMASVSPANDTPTAAAVAAAATYLKTVADVNSKAILLATDGEPNCAGGKATTADVAGAVAAIAAAKGAGFLVYVIGIGPSVFNLDSFARAGGTGDYYPATSPQDLTNALKAITTAVATCSFTLTTVPPDASNVAVYLDKSLVPEDASNGWSFGANNQTVVFAGSYCAAIASGAASNVQALFGCLGAGAPPVLP